MTRRAPAVEREVFIDALRSWLELAPLYRCDAEVNAGPESYDRVPGYREWRAWVARAPEHDWP